MDDFLLDHIRRRPPRPKVESKPAELPVTPAGAKLDTFLAGAIADLKGEPQPPQTKERPMATAPVAKPKGKGALFFQLIDEESQSDDRMDALAQGLFERRAALEKRAKRAVDTKHDRLGAAEQYLDRLEGVVEALEESEAGEGDNGGPSFVEGSADSPKPSDDATTDGSAKSS